MSYMFSNISKIKISGNDWEEVWLKLHKIMFLKSGVHASPYKGRFKSMCIWYLCLIILEEYFYM